MQWQRTNASDASEMICARSRGGRGAGHQTSMCCQAIKIFEMKAGCPVFWQGTRIWTDVRNAMLVQPRISPSPLAGEGLQHEHSQQRTPGEGLARLRDNDSFRAADAAQPLTPIRGISKSLAAGPL